MINVCKFNVPKYGLTHDNIVHGDVVNLYISSLLDFKSRNVNMK